MAQDAHVFLSFLRMVWDQWPILGPIFVSAWFAWRKLKAELIANRQSLLEMFNLQKRVEDARTNVPVIVEILEDLADLEQAFIFYGLYIEGLEHRCPNIQFEDGDAINSISVAQRIFQLKKIARRVINNCRKVHFLIPKDTMPKTVAVCKRIVDAWMSKKNGQKHAYVIKIGRIGSILQFKCDRKGLSGGEQKQWKESYQRPQAEEEIACREIAEELEKFQDDLETCVSEEFPTYAMVCQEKIFPTPPIFLANGEKR